MRRTRIAGVIYTGLVGSRLRIRKKAVPRRIHYKRVQCSGGPLHRCVIKLDAYGDQRTLPIVLRGHVGQYVGGEWRAAA